MWRKPRSSGPSVSQTKAWRSPITTAAPLVAGDIHKRVSNEEVMAELCHFRFVTMTTIYIGALITGSTFVVHLQWIIYLFTRLNREGGAKIVCAAMCLWEKFQIYF